jgi:DNA repair protein RecO (recombination protein O)
MVTDALIIRENNNIGEADRFVTALTKEFGVIRASVRGARKINNRNGSATQLLSYSRLTLVCRRDKYIITDAQPVKLFFELRSDIARLSVAQYFCELGGLLSPQEEPAGDFLRLMLNALEFLCSGKHDQRLIKAVLELRMLSLAGFMPDLRACAGCGVGESEPFYLMTREGTLLCPSCYSPTKRIGGVALSASVLAAMRHIIYAKFERCFSFHMGPEGLIQLEKASEAFLLAQLNRGFKTLDFYHVL